MPYVLRHARSGELFACELVNRYELPYYGVKDWADETEALAEKGALLAKRSAGEAEADGDDWQVTEVEERQLKLANVRLRNDPAFRVRLDAEGAIYLMDGV